jgi:uncharacterized cupin superfamily protein
MSTKSTQPPHAIVAADAPVRTRPSVYPAPFAERVAHRRKQPLGDLFGLSTFGVNLTTLLPGAQSSLLHRHSRQDEFIYVLQGTPTLVTDAGESLLQPGMCAGFPAGGIAHHLVNRSNDEVIYLEIGDRTPADQATYPSDDLQAVLGADGQWHFTHKDGRPY